MPERIHSSTKIGLVQLRVSDLSRSVAFYREVVGLKLLAERNGAAELGVEGSGTLLRLTEIAGTAFRPRRPGAGLYHFALLLPDRKSLGLALRNLIARGIHIGQSDHLVSEALYISDPDNNGIEIYRDRPRDTWKFSSAGEVMMAVDPIDWDGLLEEAGSAAWEGLPAGTVVGHIHLHVSDLAATRYFYQDILGFGAMAHMGNAALFVSAGGYHHHIGLNTWAGVGAPLAPIDAAGLDYYRIDLPNRTALAEVVQRLRDAGIATADGGDGVIVAHDPSCIEIRFSALT